MMRRSKAWMAGSAVAMMIVAAACVLAQMPGMELPAKPEQASAEPAETTEAVTPSGQAAGDVDMMAVPGLVIRFWARYMGVDSPYRSLVLVILTLLILINLKAFPRVRFAIPSQTIRYRPDRESHEL